MGMNDNPPFESPGHMEMMTLGMEPAEYAGPKEDLFVSGVRTTQLDIHVVRSSQYDPNRDALLLHAHLSTALDPQTWVQFCALVLNENQDQIMARVLKVLNQQSAAEDGKAPGSPKTVKQPKPKKESPKPEDE